MRFVIVILWMLICNLNLNAYSYAAAGKEPTIDAREEILKAINSGDYGGIKEIFIKNEQTYRYLNNSFNSSLYEGLKGSIEAKKEKEILRWLNISLACEIQRRLEGALENIKDFNIAKVMMAKTDRYYKILSANLSNEYNKILKEAIKKCSDSIGSPGLFGAGAKEANIEEYKKNQKIIVDILKTL